MIDQNVKTLLKKLFRVAENDASTDGEIDNAMRIAKTLMSQHQIERDDVFEGEDGDVNVTKVEYGKRSRYSMYTSICAWESYLCKFITEFVPGTGYYVNRGAVRRNRFERAVGKATLITFYGPDADVEFCGELFDEVVYFVQSAAQLRFGSAMARGEAAAYAEGFAAGLYEANKREAEKIEKASTSDCYALAVVNRSLAIKDGGKQWLSAEHGIKLSKGRGARSAAHKSLSAYERGKTDGASYKPGAQKKSGYIA